MVDYLNFNDSNNEYYANDCLDERLTAGNSLYNIFKRNF